MPYDLIALLSPTKIVLFIIVFTRIGGMMLTAPLISTYPIPPQVKIWFMATIAFIMFPLVMSHSHFVAPTNVPELVVILIKELTIGYITGFVANIVFIGVEIAADLVSMQVGLTAAQALNPMTGDTSPILTQSYTIMAALIFMGLNGYQWLFSSLYKTFQVIPPGYSFIINGQITQNIIYVTSQIFSVGLGIALPIFSVLLITDVLLGVVAKMMPQMNIFMVALPVKLYMGFVLIIMLTPAICTQIQILLERYLASIIKVLGG